MMRIGSTAFRLCTTGAARFRFALSCFTRLVFQIHVRLEHFRKYCRIRSVEDAVGRVTGDKIAGATG
jgi:hypothetical protein